MESTSHKSERSLHGKHVAQMYQGFIFPQLYLQLPFLWLTPLSSSSYYFKSISCLFAHLHLQLSSLFKKNKQTNKRILLGTKKERARLSLFRPAGYVVRWLKRLQGHRFGARRYPCGTRNRLHYSNKPSYTPDRSGMLDSFYIVGHIQPTSTVSGPDRRNFLLCQCKAISTVNRWKKKRCN